MSVLRSYDEAFKDFVKVKLNGKDVPIVGPVGPLRAFARVRDLLKDDPRVVKDDKFIPLPFISFNTMTPTENMSRFRRGVLRKITYSPDANVCTEGDPPSPYDIPVQIEIWAEFADDARYIVEAFLRKWRNQPMKAIEVDHGPVWGVFNVYAHKPDIIDNSDLESEEADRLMRFTLTTTVEGFISDPTRDIKTVRQERVIASVARDPLTKPDVTVEQLIYTHSE